MIFERLASFLKNFEDPERPLLGPNLKGLYLCGLWQTGSKTRNIIFNTFHFLSVLFVLSQITELYNLRNDLNKALSNFSLTALSVICASKTVSYVLLQSHWLQLVKEISKEEVREIKKQNQKTLILIEKYTKYARAITYFYWLLVTITNIALLLAPLLKYLLTPSFKEGIREGTEPYPQIISSWFPFDNLSTPGYFYASSLHIIMSMQGAAVIATYDTSAVTIMTFLKGQLGLLRKKCTEIFDCEIEDSRYHFMVNIIECHRHHNFLIKQYKLFNFLLSPVMSLYILVCSITICCSVVQFTSNEITTYQKLWVVQYTVGQVFQLLLYCWHANEVYLEVEIAPANLDNLLLTKQRWTRGNSEGHSKSLVALLMSIDVDRGIFDSDWWKADIYVKRQILLLAGKLNQPLSLSAGPFSELSVATFISIMKGSYSFFTLLGQMQES